MLLLLHARLLQGFIKQFQWQFGTTMACHGAIGLWRRDVLGKKVSAKLWGCQFAPLIVGIYGIIIACHLERNRFVHADVCVTGQPRLGVYKRAQVFT